MRKGVARHMGRRSHIFAVILGVIALLMLVSCSDDSPTSTQQQVTTSSTSGTEIIETTPSGDGQERALTKSAQEYEAQIPELEKVVQANPQDLTALQNLALAQYNANRFEDAAATYVTMLTLEDSAFLRNNYGNVLREWGKTDEAKAQFEKAIATDPSLTSAYLNLATMFEKEKNLTAAIEVLDRGLSVLTGGERARLEKYKTDLSTKK